MPTPSDLTAAAEQPSIVRIDSLRPGVRALMLIGIALGTLVTVFGGPAMGDHEALVAQCAREMRQTGNWLVPQFLGEPYMRKPPLPYWLIAGLSYVMPNDANGLPVTTTVARLPSALAAFGTVLLIWKLASVMFNRRVGAVAAVMAGSSVFFMLYAANVTVEMLLTFCCTWAYLHFWLALRRPRGCRWRLLHFFLFYVAMGLGMMAKGPFPMAMVGLPIAVWWYGERPMRMIARSRGRALLPAVRRFVRGLGPRTIKAFRELWLIPGLIVFALCFVPWMVLVGREHPDSWDLWNWQYWQRVQGKYEDTRERGFFYYVPVIAGLVLPWAFAIFEGMISPWIAKYARQRRALLYVGMWALVGTVVMSAMSFKKPYYVAPVIPAFILLTAPAAERFYSDMLRHRRLAWGLWIGLIAGAVGVLAGGQPYLRKEVPDAAGTITIITAVGLVLLILAGYVFIHNRRWIAFGLTASTSVFMFLAVWFGCGSLMDDFNNVAALDHLLDKHSISGDAHVYWVIRRPDARLSFYFNRWTEQMIQPAEIVEKIVDRTMAKNQEALEQMVVDRADELLARPHAVYLILPRKEYQLAKIFGFAAEARIVGAVKDAGSTDDDWIVVANDPGKASTRPR